MLYSFADWNEVAKMENLRQVAREVVVSWDQQVSEDHESALKSSLSILLQR